MKKFFFACAAILCLALAYHFGATNAQGQSSGSIRWVGDTYIATDSQIWKVSGTGWQTLSEVSDHEPPVPANQVLYYYYQLVVTTSGEAYAWVGGAWVSRGFIPGGSTPAQSISVGQLKAKYR